MGAEKHPSALILPDATGDASADVDNAIQAPAVTEASPSVGTGSKSESSPDSGADSPPTPDKRGSDAKSPDPGKSPKERDEEGFRRLDYCDECWQKMKDHVFFSFWIGKPKASDLPPKKLNRAERDLALAALFDSLNERNGSEADYSPHLFFLAHLLMKYKLFKWKPARIHPKTGQSVLVFGRSDSEEEVEIPDVEMSDEAIVRVKDEVEAYLAKSVGQEVKL